MTGAKGKKGTQPSHATSFRNLVLDISPLIEDDIYLLSEESLGWHFLSSPLHTGLKRWVEDLNRLYRSEPALHELDFDLAGFEWALRGEDSGGKS